MPQKRARAPSNTKNGGNPVTKKKKVEINEQQKQQKQDFVPDKITRSTPVPPSPAKNTTRSRNKIDVNAKAGNAARECTVPTDILDDADNKILSQRYNLLVQGRYRAHKQAQELPYYLSRPKGMLPLVLDNTQNSPEVAERKRKEQEKELREWINLGVNSCHLPNVVLRVAGLTSQDAEDEEEEEEERERRERQWEELAEKEDNAEDNEEMVKEVGAADTAGNSVVEDPAKEDASSGDEDYAKNYYESENEDGGENEN